MYQLSDDKSHYYFSTEYLPVLRIASGETVRFETKDCLSNVLRRQEDRLEDTSFDKEKVNPVTGPVYIEGALPGDMLEITIDDIQFKDRAVITCQAGYGVIGKYFDRTTFRITPIQGDSLTFDHRLKIPLDPMVGVIGTTPPTPIRSEYIGEHGGNMDNTMMRKGARLYLPVLVEGGLVAVGDVHAVMGDGEINCSAIEAPAFVTLTIRVCKDMRINYPMLVDKDNLALVVSKETLDEAVDTAVEEMALLLRDKLDLPFDHISMLLSAVGQAQICQVVNTLKTARYLMPLYVLETYGFRVT